MAVRYEYKCDLCGHEYLEQREATQSQFFIKCNRGDGGNYELVNEIKLEDIKVSSEVDSTKAPSKTVK